MSELPLKQVCIYTGADFNEECHAGAWSCILVFGEHRKELNGFVEGTSLERMAMMAAISGLGALKMPCSVTVFSNCDGLINDFNHGMHERWKKSFWKNSDGSQVVNADLWMVLSIQALKHRICFKKLPEIQQPSAQDEKHQPQVHPDILRCDTLVKESIQEFRRLNALDVAKAENASAEKKESMTAGKT